MPAPHIITPLSGEIMSGTPRGPAAGNPSVHVEDAEFVTIGRAETAPRVEPPSISGLDILGRAPQSVSGRAAGAGFWICGALVAAAAFWMAGGHSLARNLQVAQAPKASSVHVATLSSRVARTGTGLHLVIDGTLANSSPNAAKAPDLDIEVGEVGGGIVHYRFGNGGAIIEAGGARSFSSRLAAPRNGVSTVSVKVAGDL